MCFSPLCSPPPTESLCVTDSCHEPCMHQYTNSFPCAGQFCAKAASQEISAWDVQLQSASLRDTSPYQFLCESAPRTGPFLPNLGFFQFSESALFFSDIYFHLCHEKNAEPLPCCFWIRGRQDCIVSIFCDLIFSSASFSVCPNHFHLWIYGKHCPLSAVFPETRFLPVSCLLAEDNFQTGVNRHQFDAKHRFPASIFCEGGC